MTEGRVTVSINGKDYPMACQPGEEAKVAALGKRIDEVVRKVATATGPIGEARLLVMASLIIADSLDDLENRDPAAAKPAADPASAEAEATLASRIENLATRLERLASGKP